MEFKARKIKVGSDNPFENDKLNREPEVTNLSLLLRNAASPIVLSVNAPWGAGKTTFLEMLNADLINKGSTTIYFNAWATDFANDPLIAFLGEMNEVLKSHFVDSKEKGEAWEKAKQAGTHILKKGIPALVKMGTAGILDTEKIIEDETVKLMEGFSKDLIDVYLKNKNAISNFKENIAKVLKDKEGENTKLFIFVDELDRCRPTYSIELLERIKHLLDLEGLVFILALDKQQLAHSVKAVYGSDFDALGYLRRFIDIEYKLKSVELNSFIDHLFNTFGFDEFFDLRKKHSVFADDTRILKDVFKLVAKFKQLPLREVEQIFSKLNLVILSTDENVFLYPELTPFLLIVKESYTNVYENYILESSTPDEIIELLYSMLPEGERYDSHICSLIEGYLIAAKKDDYKSRLGKSIAKHENIITDEKIPEKIRRYSNKVIEFANFNVKKTGWEVNLSSIVERIEMIEQFKFGDRD